MEQALSNSTTYVYIVDKKMHLSYPHRWNLLFGAATKNAGALALLASNTISSTLFIHNSILSESDIQVKFLACGAALSIELSLQVSVLTPIQIALKY